VTFSEATAVVVGGDGAWSGEIASGWDIAGNANGGYLMAMAARAAAAVTGRPDPVSVTAHFLAPGRSGPVSGEVSVLKEGKRFSTVAVEMGAEGRRLLTMLGTFGEATGASAVERVGATPPDLPPPDECLLLVATDTFPPPFVDRVEVRLHPAVGAPGSGSGDPAVEGWFRLRDGEPMDTLALLLAVDSFPPTVFFADLPIGWVPTIEMTTHVRARPVEGWLACRFTTRFITGGFFEEDGEVWDAAGRLVAQSRQLALLTR
jgi:acyl-CoA thioesterase